MRLPRKGATAAVAVSAVLLTGCTGSSSGVQTAAVGRSTVSEVVEAPATVQAAASTTITSPATGTVSAVYVKDGQRIAAGTLLARISSPQAEAQLTQARSALAQVDSSAPSSPALLTGGAQTQADTAAQGAFAAARAAAAGITDPRLKAAALTQIATAEHQFQLAAAQARAAIAAINSGIGSLSSALASLTAAQRVQAQTAVQIAQNAVDALEVTAPIAGTVQLGGGPAPAGSGSDLGDVLSQLPADQQQQAASALGGAAPSSGGEVQTTGPVTVGSPVSTGTTLATIIDVSTLALAADVDETDVFLVKPGVKAEAELDAVPGAQYPATVASVGLSPTQSARGGVSYRARLTLAAGTMPDGSRAPTPRPGMSAVADLQVRTARDAISVPATAIVRSGDRDAVWVVEDGHARRRTVTVGTEGEDAVAVTEGLRVGEQVVVRGADQVQEGQELSLTGTAALEAVDVTRTYELGDSTVQALRGVSVRVDPGDYIAVVGPSGSGKSTLMHLLGALDRPSSGTLLVGGRDVATMGKDELARARNETIGFVFQSFQLLPRTTAVDNVAMPLVYRGLRRPERRRRAQQALEAVGMGHRLTHTPNQLSGGEQQRVAIARALVGDPQVILADEPTGNLDSVRGTEVMELLEALNRDRGVALVVVTHDLELAARAPRQLRMRDGAAELWDRTP